MLSIRQESCSGGENKATFEIFTVFQLFLCQWLRWRDDNKTTNNEHRTQTKRFDSIWIEVMGRQVVFGLRRRSPWRQKLSRLPVGEAINRSSL